MRRGVAERGAVELKKNEYEEEIKRQKEQMSHMESLFKRQLEGSQNVCSQDKVTHQCRHYHCLFCCCLSHPAHMNIEDCRLII